MHNALGKPLAVLDLKRWIRLNRIVYKMEKIDLLNRTPDVGPILAMLEWGDELDARISLRTDCSAPPCDLAALQEAGLFDVFLTPSSPNDPKLGEWMRACHDADLDVRLQLEAPLPRNTDIDSLADRIAASGNVVAFNMAMHDPFTRFMRPNRGDSDTVLKEVNALVAAVEAKGIESNLLRLPYCFVSEENMPRAATRIQFHLDHQHYGKQSYELAEQLYPRSPQIVGKLLMMYLGHATSWKNPIDAIVISYLMYQKRWAFARLAALHKLTRHLKYFPGMPKRNRDPEAEYKRDLKRLEKQQRSSRTAAVAQCRYRRITDYELDRLQRVLPGLEPHAVPGELITSPMHFAANQRKHYDDIDAARCGVSEGHEALAKKANEIVNNVEPDYEVDSFKVHVKGTFHEAMPGGVRWFSVSNCEKLTWPIAELQPPFTISTTFGGGIADYIGYSFGRHCKLLCPMEAFSHRLVLHVEADGHYVLLRDGKRVQPLEFEGQHYVPTRLGGRLEPCLSIWNIDQTIVTQTMQVWEGEKLVEQTADDVKYSILIVSTRYTRRLQAVFRSIAHQQGIDLKQLEIILCYVPGVDGSDDLIDSMQLTHPDLRILRCPFPEQNANSKGFMINEGINMARGEWIMLLDSDILLPPNWFTKVREIEDPDTYFIAPDGRKMLPKDVTAKILLGEVAPWDHWDDLLTLPCEFRLREAWGMPIGFCQVVRRECFDKVDYDEYDHFEGADWKFGKDIREEYAMEKRLSGVAVLHLDHGGSQWYGTQKHF
jgi:hypothetical protein